MRPEKIWGSSIRLRRAGRTTIACAAIVLIGAVLFRIDGFVKLSNEPWVSVAYVAVLAGLFIGAASALVCLFHVLRSILGKP